MVNIILESLTKTFGTTVAVDRISLDIPAGSLFFLLGPSGCGKTTLLLMIAGFVLPTAGRVRFGAQDMTYVPPYQRDTGMVFQSYALWPHMTVAQNVAFGLDVRKMPASEKRQRVAWALALVQMQTLAERKPNQLSGGQQQRVALARALAIKPRCLLLDEPLSNLDAKLRLEMRGELKRIVKQAEITTIYVTHDQKEALSMADGIALLRAGRLEQTGTPEDLYRRPASRFVADFIGESNFLSGIVEAVDAASVRLGTAAGTIYTARAGSQSWTQGQHVLAAFRPEAVTFAAAGSTGTNILKARRVSSAYLGELAEHIVTLDGMAAPAPGQAATPPIKAFELNPVGRPTDAAAGQSVLLRIEPAQFMLVPAE